MATSEYMKSPLEQVWRQIIPQAHDQTLKNAFYNVAAAVFVLAVAVSAWTVYLIMQPFVQALLWAVLVGSLLHPIKHEISASVRRWLASIKEVQSLLSLNVAVLPLTWIDSLSEFVGWYVVSHMKVVVGVTVILPVAFIIIHYTPAILSQLAYSLISLFYYGTKYFLSTIHLLYFVSYLIPVAYIFCLFWYYNEETKSTFRRISFPVWIMSIAAFVSNYPLLGVPLFALFVVLLVGGIVKEASDLQKSKDTSEGSVLQSMFAICMGQVEDNSNSDKNEITKVEVLEPEVEQIETPETDFDSLQADKAAETPVLHGSKQVRFKPLPTSTQLPDSLCQKEERAGKESNSNFYLKAVFAACLIVQMWKYSFLLTILPLPIGYYMVKKFTSYHFMANDTLKGTVCIFIGEKWKILKFWIGERKQAIFPFPIRGVCKLLITVDHQIAEVLSSSTDAFVTISIMLSVMVIFILVSIFLAVQIQGEGMHLITMGSQLVNATIMNNPQFKQMLPEGLNDMLGSATSNAYQYGRVWLSDTVKNFIGETDDVKAQALEKEVIKLWDHIYQAWVVAQPESPYVGPVVTSEAVAETFDSLVDGIRQSPDLFSLTSLSDIIKDNIGTVMSVADGIRSILMSNLNLAFSIFTAVVSLILGGSLSILNALLNMAVFLSALFYILSISGSVYKPVAFLSDLSPGQMNMLGVAVEEAINGVFIASFKMGAFYGMWTWMLHSIFATKIVYIPSVLGALFGAVPLLGTYWAAIPGAIELFWGHNSPILAILLIVAQLLPLSCVDTTIYSEIKGGGHPYLTGLAVAGGIFCWGMEGAIFGPLVLCILLVATKMYASLIHAPTDGSQLAKKLRRCQSEFRLK